jgi:hypothetical protein
VTDTENRQASCVERLDFRVFNDARQLADEYDTDFHDMPCRAWTPACEACSEPIMFATGWVHTDSDEAKCDPDDEDSPNAWPHLLSGCTNCDFDEDDHAEEYLRLLQLARDFESVGGDLDDLSEDSIDEQVSVLRNDYGLSLDTKLVCTWQLSTGGPGDQFELTIDASEPHRPAIDSITYRFMDWFDGASVDLHGDEFDLVAGMIEPYLDGIIQAEAEMRFERRIAREGR